MKVWCKKCKVWHNDFSDQGHLTKDGCKPRGAVFFAHFDYLDWSKSKGEVAVNVVR